MSSIKVSWTIVAGSPTLPKFNPFYNSLFISNNKHWSWCFYWNNIIQTMEKGWFVILYNNQINWSDSKRRSDCVVEEQGSYDEEKDVEEFVFGLVELLPCLFFGNVVNALRWVIAPHQRELAVHLWSLRKLLLWFGRNTLCDRRFSLQSSGGCWLFAALLDSLRGFGRKFLSLVKLTHYRHIIAQILELLSVEVLLHDVCPL